MPTWIALFRGINVGGHGKLPMAELRKELESLGFGNPQTYIQSGNVLLDAKQRSADRLADKIASRVDHAFGFRPRVMVLSPEQLLAAVQANPFPEAHENPKSLHYFFLQQPAVDAAQVALEKLRSGDEAFRLTEQVLYVYAPSGFANSKLGARAESALGVAATARNARTVDKLAEMICQRQDN